MAQQITNFLILTGNGIYLPSFGTTVIDVVAIGGGGGSGGVFGDGESNFTSGGGGGGSWCMKRIPSPAGSYPYLCGIGGPGGSARPGNGNDGGATIFGSPALLIAPGGLRSTAKDNSNYRTGLPGNVTAAPTGGDINVAGQAGGIGAIDPVTCVPFTSGVGGSGRFGTGGAFRATGGPGNRGTGFGAGGGGAADFATGAAAGAEGTNGAILVWEYSG
jgi:glycine rich protein